MQFTNGIFDQTNKPNMQNPGIIFGDDAIAIKRNDLLGLMFKQYVKIDYQHITTVLVSDALNINEKKAFNGTGNFWNFFPSGLKMKAGEKVFLIGKRNTRWVTGFSSADWRNAIAILNAKKVELVYS
jgi:hypothetical protein